MKQDIGAALCSGGNKTLQRLASEPEAYRGKLLTPRQAAAFLQISERTCRSWCELGLLPAIKIGRKLWRIWESDLLQCLERRLPEDSL